MPEQKILDHYTDLFAQRRISRREFMGRASAFGLSVAAASALAGKAARAATPNQGGTLRMALGTGSTTDSTDPASYNDTYMQVFGLSFRNNLTEVDNHDKLAGELAESWEASDDATQWTFQLRKDVEFHNGKSLTPEDVIASVQHHTGEDSKSPAKPILSSITETVKDGPNSVTFKLSEGNADFPFLLSDYHVAIMPANADGSVDWQSAQGTGGYIVKNFEPGVRADLERNPNYFKSDRAHFESLEILSVIDINARSNSLVTGEVDVIDRVDLKTVHLLGRSPGVRIEETQGNLHNVYSMFCDAAPFDNVDVRLALKYALNREQLLDKILFGHGYVGNDHPIGKANQYYAADLPQRTYDPDKAKFHLKKAGLSELSVQLHAADAAFAGAVDGAILYREAALPTGIDIEVVRSPNDGYWSNVWNVKPWAASYWSGRATEDWMFSTAYEAGVPWNETHWNNARFNELLKQARAELDSDKRRSMYYEMQQLCSDDGGVVVPVFSNYVFATSDKVAHDEAMSAAWDLDGVKCAERWWFA